MRVLCIRRSLLAAAVLVVGVLIASDAFAQGGLGGMGGGGMGGMPDPGAIFKDKKPKEVVGLSLAASDQPVLEVRIEGNQLIPTAQILNEMQTRAGRPYDPALVQRDVRKLTGRSWFMAVDTDIDKQPDGYVVTIKVVERPTIRYIEYLGNDVDFLGRGGIRDKKLAKETGLKVGGSIDPYAVEDARRKIIDLYRRNGFNSTQVSILEGNKPTDKGVVFVIHEGEAQKIWKVEFEGNEFVGDGRLRTQIESKKPMMYIFKGFVDREQIDGDVDRLTAYYRAFGYFQAKVGRKLEYNEKGNWVTLRFVIHEGPRYEVRHVSHIGAKIFADSSLSGGMTLPAGQKFEQAKMNNDLQWLKDLYGSQGYVFADIRAEPVFLEEPGKIDLVYHIDEGKQWKVGRIFVHIDGDNPHTRIQTALNRLSFRPGQIVDIREIHASERRLQASSLFLADPAAGSMPKITYKIRDMNENVASADGESFRGQSPDGIQPAAPNQPNGAPANEYEIRPPGYVPDTDAIDVHLDIESGAPPATAAPPAPSPAEQSANPYRTLVVRTQSPYQPPISQPYAPAPATSYPPSQASYPVTQAGGAVAPGYAANAYAAGAYGGQAVRATGPDSTPVGYNAQPVQPIQQAQYAQPQYTQAAPPNTMFAAPPAAPQPITPIGQPVGPLPPPAVVSGPAYVAPGVPVNPQLFPSGATEPWAQTYDDRSVDIFVDANEAQTGRLMLGVAVNSDAGLFGQILLDEQNFDWRRWPTSMEDVVSGRAWRGAGQRFRLEAMPGTQVQRYIASFQEPYLFDTPVSFGLSGSYYDRRFEDWTEQRLGGRVSFGYQWTADDVSAALAYRGESIKVFDPAVQSNPTAIPPIVGVPELDEVLDRTNSLNGFKLTLANDTRDSAFFPTSGHYAELGVEQVIGTYYYPRATLDLRQYGLITERPDHSGRHVLSFSSQLGFTGSNTPIYDTFYSGGIQFPGFQFHSVSPVKEAPGGQNIQIGGDFQWINSLEYLFPLTADDMLHGSLFLGFGTVEENVTLDWSRFRVAPGFGFRITIPAMGPAPIALNFAVPIADAPTDDSELFSFTVGFTR